MLDGLVFDFSFGWLVVWLWCLGIGICAKFGGLDCDSYVWVLWVFWVV